jgi:NADPH:quinone reductase-like Zn-dependent oxidoreductase
VKAIVQSAYGSTDVLGLQDVAEPEVGDDQVLVRVRAAGLDAGVWHLMTGLPYLVRMMTFGRPPKGRVLGMDVAGRVEAVGKSVTGFVPGDEVFGACQGAFAEYAVAKQANVVPKPARLSFEQAAAVPVSALTALQALREKGGVRSGQSVLIIGAGGGVGTFAVQLARAFGAEVTGVCSATKRDLVRSLGAEHVIDYARDDFAQAGRRYELIVDAAGKRPLSHLRRALTPRGTLVMVGGEGGGRWLGGIGLLMRGLALSPFVRQRLRPLLARVAREDLLFLKELIEAEKLTPVIDRTYPLRDVAEAVRYFETEHPRGKVVIAVSTA